MKTNLDVEGHERDERLEVMKAIKAGKRNKNSRAFIDVCRDIVENGYQRYRGSMIDSYSASAYIAVYDAIKNPEQKEKLEAIAKDHPAKAMSIVWKLVK